MNTKLATTQIRLTEWASIIKDCKSSGLKVDEYCRQHDIHEMPITTGSVKSKQLHCSRPDLLNCLCRTQNLFR